MDMFHGQFWDSVNKIFVLDSCYSGGFGVVNDSPVFLLAFPKTALIAAAAWDMPVPALGFFYGQLMGRGALSIAFADALTLGPNGLCLCDKDGVPGVSFSEIEAYCRASVNERGTYTGAIRGDDTFTLGAMTGNSVVVSDWTTDLDTSGSGIIGRIHSEEEFKVLEISGSTTSGSTITWACEVGYSYQLQYSDTLQIDDWHNLGPARTWSSGGLIITHTDRTAIGRNKRFYRIVKSVLP